MKLTKKELEDWFDKYNKEVTLTQKIKNDRIKSNFKALNLRAKELGKEIPDYLAVVVYLDQPVGSWIFEKYKEWLE